VLVFNSWPTTTQRRSKRWGREPEPQNVPAETGLSRATIVDSTAIDEPAAQAWLDGLDREAAEDAVDEGLRVLNLAIRTHRAAAADPMIREVGAEQALAIRAGYGIGEEVAEGAWTSARELDQRESKRKSRRERRIATLRPQERLAAVLGGRDAVLACEELALRARLDLDAAQQREGALQTHLAVEAAIVEFQAFRDADSVARRLIALEEIRADVSSAANEALQGGLRQETIDTVAEALRQVESLLRARSATAAY
jgi:hypothetical protein